jgi:pimeloyl-ACP methyl ester carboxylesterase
MKPTETAPATEQVQIRIHGTETLPTLVYLPGLHGNWTLIGGFRKALAGRLRFVETTYPPTLTWSLEEYAAAVERALEAEGITSGWILAESFGSQIAWPLIQRGEFRAKALILAGGFVRHPMRWAARIAEQFCGHIPFAFLTRTLFGYAKLSRWRFRTSPETIKGIEEFIERLTELERQAARHRLHLVAQSDPCEVAQKLQMPLYALTGLFDPVVPWLWTRRWLKKNCPALREYKIIWHADHNVLGTGSQVAADQVVEWIERGVEGGG